MPNKTIKGRHSRVLSYFTAEFILRAALPIAAAFDNDYESVLIFLTIITQNDETLMLSQASRKRYASLNSAVPDTLIRPISRMALARLTGLPRETVRRKVLKLVERGYVEDTPRGLIVPQCVREMPLYAELVAAQESNLRRLFSMVGDVIAKDAAAVDTLPAASRG